MKRIMVMVVMGIVTAALVLSCNNGMSSTDRGGSERRADKSRRTVIDTAEYTDFTVAKHDARSIRREDVIYALNGATFKNGDSYMVIKANEGTIEISSGAGRWNGKENCQIYGIFGFDIQAASSDCLYFRRDQRKEGFLMVDGNIFRDDAIPDLAVCLPLYGYSRNRVEVSSVMDGYIAMPSGTYWRK